MSDESTYDFVAVGCGAAGLSAAVAYAEAAAREGREARVAVLERAPEGERGGATRWTTAGMRMDEDYLLDPMWVGRMQDVSKGLSDLAYSQAFEREIPNTGRFLVDHGVELNARRPSLAAAIHVSTSPNGGGLAIVDALAAHVEAHPGSEILYRTEAVRLSLSEEGAVDGVVVRGPDGHLRTLHAGAVVLACGGFEGSKEMMTRYVGRNACDLKLIAPGVANNKGDGIRMAMEIGADTAGQFDGIHAEMVDRRTDRADAVLYGHTYGILVNDDAQRFYDEGATSFDLSFELVAYEIWSKQDNSAYFITDQTAMDNDAITGTYDTDVPPAKADTIAELAVLLGLDDAALTATVERFNAACPPGEFDPTQLDGRATEGLEVRKSNWADPIARAPFYGYPVTASICFTYGGVRTDAEARVVTGNDRPIPGLYAAGEIVGLFYHEYVAATSVLKALTFGRLAGEHAAANAAQLVVAS